MAGAVKISSGATGLRLPALVAQYGKDAERVVQAGVTGAEVGMLAEMRGEIADAFPGARRLPTTITGATFPNRPGVASLEAAAWVRPRGAKIGAVLGAFVQGATIRAASGLCLAIPTAAVPRIAGRKMTPDEVKRRFGRPLDMIPAKRGGRAWGALVLREAYASGKAGRVRLATKRTKRDRVKSVVMFILVPVVDLPKRLDPERIAQKWAGQVPALIERAAARLGV